MEKGDVFFDLGCAGEEETRVVVDAQPGIEVISPGTAVSEIPAEAEKKE